VTSNLIEFPMAARPRSETHERFERLMERYSALLHSVVAQHCPRGVGIEAGDIEQEARVRLWRALEREKELTDPASYIYRIAVTSAIDAVRRVVARREDQLSTDASDDDQAKDVLTIPTDPSHAPDAVAARRELMARIAAAVVSLPENRRRAVELHLQGLSLSEIGELLGWSEAKARNLVYRGLDDLRDALRREGIDYE
jgi:RNA polymerase sigma factor (sigma-70 family)